MRDGGGKKGRQEGRAGSEGAKKRTRDKKKDGKKVKEEAGAEGGWGKVKDKRIEVVIKVEGEGGEVTVSTPLLCVFFGPRR